MNSIVFICVDWFFPLSLSVYVYQSWFVAFLSLFAARLCSAGWRIKKQQPNGIDFNHYSCCCLLLEQIWSSYKTSSPALKCLVTVWRVANTLKERERKRKRESKWTWRTESFAVSVEHSALHQRWWVIDVRPRIAIILDRHSKRNVAPSKTNWNGRMKRSTRGTISPIHPTRPRNNR